MDGAERAGLGNPACRVSKGWKVFFQWLDGAGQTRPEVAFHLAAVNKRGKGGRFDVMARTPKPASYWYFLYEDAHTSLVEGNLSSYSVGGQTFTKNNLTQIVEQMNYWRGRMEMEESGGNGTSVVNMGQAGFVEE